MAKAAKVTHRSIAREAKVSVATVTRALKADPKVAPETRRRVLAVARRLGYEPDPDLARLMRRLRRGGGDQDYETIAYLRHLDPDSWSAQGAGKMMREGCETAAKALGYGIDDIRLPEPPGRELHRVLQARGIRGLVIESFAPDPFPWELPWEQYATVQLGSRPRKEAFHCVDADDYLNVRLAMRMLRQAGCQRVGFVTTAEDVSYTESAYLGHFIANSPMPDAPRFILREERFENEGEAFRHWLKREGIDGILSTFGLLDNWLDNLDYRYPEDLALAHANTMKGHRWGGVLGHDTLLGRTAVETLALCLESGQIGPIAPPIIRLVPGTWQWGETIRRQ